MATMTKLFEKITANDYEWLEQLVQTKQNVNWNCVRFSISLVQKAIEVRALECFNILMTIPELTIFSVNGHVNGLRKAMEYCIISSNQSNYHYLTKLLEKNVVVNTEHIGMCINNQSHNNVLFNILFDRIAKTESNMKYILNHIIRNNNLALLLHVYNFLETNNLTFYTLENNLLFNNKIYNDTIQYMNSEHKSRQHIKMQLIEYIMTKNVDWKSTNNIPVLYTFYMYDNIIGFEKFYPYYQGLSKEEINSIPNITNLKQYISRSYNIEHLRFILKLPIDFTDMAPYIGELFRKIYQNYNSHYNAIQPDIMKIYANMMILFMNNKVLSNPYTHLINEINTIKQYIEYVKKSNNYNAYFKNIRMFTYINKHFNYEITDTMNETFMMVFSKDINIMEEKAELIATLNNIINPAPIVKNKSKKKKINNIIV